MATITLRPGKERPVIQHHPWIFSGAIAAVRGDPLDGEPVDVLAASGDWLARGLWSGRSQIRVRLCTWDPNRDLDAEWLHDRVARALAGRRHLLNDPECACRLVFSEADGLPGLIVDRYGHYLSVQILTQGMELRREALVRSLVELLNPLGIFERSDVEMREKEGLPPAEGVLWGQAPPNQLVLRPIGVDPPRFLVDLQTGQKTGSYLDQALNRAHVAAYCAGAEVLDCFTYSGGFSLYAARAGANHLTLIDTSPAALDLARQHLVLNELETPAEFVEGDVFKVLRTYREQQRRFDVIILDPPKFAHSQAHIDRAARGYKDINLLAMQLLRPGGILATFSCSGLVSTDLFQKIVFGASVDARRDAQIIERLAQSPDHPILLTFPESEYLKGFVCRIW
ncbi:class I SAM-dependent rRNA methyltransferase [Candidatus Oscillochloris fontis]|uniref:class I SAM-dependent rRNA methyltransferase n=1 Tax=Candidatus Oscillochloris fontis TaxID=2496868 RepID=UPI00101BDFFB|nr:class I SAM-dependent methyltransferase [Candidatus Oscillochloris fontis]